MHVSAFFLSVDITNVLCGLVNLACHNMVVHIVDGIHILGFLLCPMISTVVLLIRNAKKEKIEQQSV